MHSLVSKRYKNTNTIRNYNIKITNRENNGKKLFILSSGISRP